MRSTPSFPLNDRACAQFLEQADEHGGLPRFVVREFEEYLNCGLLEHGLVRLACESCGHEMAVAFSCKRRGFCPSCLARRMSDQAAHLVDRVLPPVPIRQWVCSLPWGLRAWLAFDRALCTEILEAFTDALLRSLRHRAKQALGLSSVTEALPGAVTAIQRTDSSLRVNVHFHTIALDGVYVQQPDGSLSFEPLGDPTAEEMEQVARWTFERAQRVLGRRGRELDLEGRLHGHDDGEVELTQDQPVLASCLSASAHDQQLLGDAPGERTTKLRGPVSTTHSEQTALGWVGGFNVHAGPPIEGTDRTAVERLCRYVCRPPLSTERLSLREDGQVVLGLKRRWRDGTRAIVLSPLDLIARLCALVPPPRFHMLRYQGVLAPHSAARAQVVPKRPPSRPLPVQLQLVFDAEAPEHCVQALPPPPERCSAPSPTRHLWAWLLRRVFSVDVETCERCGGRMKILQVAKTHAQVQSALFELGYSLRPPPSRAPPLSAAQLALPFG